MQKKTSMIRRMISTIFIIMLLVIAYQYYQKYNFNDFIKAEYTRGLSKFERDSSVKYNENNSYKIQNNNYNDAMFYKTVSVLPNTPYKVSCKIKTENVENKTKYTDSGAHICIADTTEKSDNVIGTTDWTTVEFYFNSKNRNEVDIGFRLGGFEDSSIGIAWFSDLTIELGIADESNTWNFLCILFENVDVTLEQGGQNQNIKLQLTATDKEDMRLCMRRFKSSMEELSEGKMKIHYDIVESNEPITSVSYDEENGYYVSGYNIKEVMNPYINQGIYDHIFIAFRTGNINTKGSIPVNDWIGLGSMEYRGIGFSNIRLPDDDSDYIYKYDTRINTFPEEVYVHEFLHTLERNAEEYGYTRPELHDNLLYGYTNQNLIGLKTWYQDYMNQNIQTTNRKNRITGRDLQQKTSQNQCF